MYKVAERPGDLPPVYSTDPGILPMFHELNRVTVFERAIPSDVQGSLTFLRQERPNVLDVLHEETMLLKISGAQIQIFDPRDPDDEAMYLHQIFPEREAGALVAYEEEELIPRMRDALSTDIFLPQFLTIIDTRPAAVHGHDFIVGAAHFDLGTNIDLLSGARIQLPSSCESITPPYHPHSSPFDFRGGRRFYQSFRPLYG